MHMEGRSLRRMRLFYEVKQSYLAEVVGVDQATVSRWERGQSPISPKTWSKIRQFFEGVPRRSSADFALRRLVENSTQEVHLICDKTHRLLAASTPRQREWRTPVADLLGKPLLPYASVEILEVDESLRDLGWYSDPSAQMTVMTGTNNDSRIPIRPGRALWERIRLSEQNFGRLVTTLAIAGEA
ncbi:MAG: transcriptional regulator [Methylocystaceae bacterium]|nr:MAG: transcriptional regulator [Methylocystaceae bacterium]